jgi:hypothetical protein
MAKKSKARSSRPKTKAKSTSDKEQSERFIETARKLEADESGKKFESTFNVIVPKK